ncbi:hypothetical protein GYMLUDRAFT_38013 [Collybiopsis luxurians FD-317 M1]|nr:hypothetical protein GYMLUDRAFT_38013 [Collybiopsis luxurians FD-317 M1]
MHLNPVYFIFGLVSASYAIPFAVRDNSAQTASKLGPSSESPGLLSSTAVIAYIPSRMGKVKGLFQGKSDNQKAAEAAETAVKEIVLEAHKAGSFDVNGPLKTWVKGFDGTGSERTIKFSVTMLEKCGKGCQGKVDKSTGNGLIMDGEGKELFKKSSKADV